MEAFRRLRKRKRILVVFRGAFVTRKKLRKKRHRNSSTNFIGFIFISKRNLNRNNMELDLLADGRQSPLGGS